MKTINRFKGEYQFLSNFYPCYITYEGITYNSVEHAYQAAKTTDISERIKISKMVAANQAKKYGNIIKKREGWESMKYSIMKELLLQKFNSPLLKMLLLETKDAFIIEGNFWHDNYWGNCTCDKCHEQGMIGNNYLGKLLMEIRQSLQ